MARKTAQDATPTPAETYAATLDALEAVRRTRDAEEPGSEVVETTLKGEEVAYVRALPSPLQLAETAARAARAALEAHGGPTAVQLEDARATQRRVDAELASFQRSPLALGAGERLAALLGRSRAAAAAVETLTETAAREARRAAEREALEGAHGPLLAEVGADLDEARARVTAAAEAAQSAMSALMVETTLYQSAARQARARLVGAGFDSATRFDGTTYPTSVGRDLHVAGRWYPEAEPLVMLAKVVHRVLRAAGERGRVMSGIVGGLTVVGGRQIDALLADAAEATAPAGEPVARPSVPALRDWANLPAPVVASRGGYERAQKAPRRFLGRIGPR
jgi:hypothetical protein